MVSRLSRSPRVSGTVGKEAGKRGRREEPGNLGHIFC